MPSRDVTAHLIERGDPATVTEMKPELLPAVHEQAVPTVTVTVPVPPAAGEVNPVLDNVA